MPRRSRLPLALATATAACALAPPLGDPTRTTMRGADGGEGKRAQFLVRLEAGDPFDELRFERLCDLRNLGERINLDRGHDELAQPPGPTLR